MKIAIINDENINIGDDIIKHGVLYLLENSFPGTIKEYLFIRPHDLKTLYTNDNKDKILISDLVVIAGMPFFWYFTYPHLIKNIRIPFLKKLLSHPLIMDYNQEIWLKRIVKYNKKVILLGIGSCMPYYSNAFDLINPTIEDFVDIISTNSILLTVRDDISSDLLTYYNIKHHKIACPSIFARKYFKIKPSNKDFIIINFMQLGGHYQFDGKINSNNWKKSVEKFVKWLIYDLNEKIIFSCHDEAEILQVKTLFPGIEYFHSSFAKDYISLYSNAKLGFVNRIHAGFPIFSFNSPVLIIGSDSRAHMNSVINMPFENVNEISFEKLQYYYYMLMKNNLKSDFIENTEDLYLNLLQNSQ